MLIFYRLGILGYSLLARILSLFNSKASKFVHGRKHWASSLRTQLEGNTSDILWFHAASLGEFEQGRPVIEAVKEKHPGMKILLTFFSPSGYEIRKNYANADWVMYLPMDTPSNAKKFISLVKPKVAIFIKYEFWYYYMRALHRAQIPVLVISAIFRSKQLYFKPWGRFFKKVLRPVNHYFIQDNQSGKLLNDLGIVAVTVTGDTRFDRVNDIASTARDIPIAENFSKGHRTLVIGSLWPTDLMVLKQVIEFHFDRMKFIIAPHNLKEAELQEIENQFEHTIRFSAVSSDTVSDKRVLIIDNIGMLSSLYRYGQMAFIGGGFRGALHNTLEAAVYGIPLFFGNHKKNEKFREAIELQQVGAAFAVENCQDLAMKINEFLDNPEKLSTAGHAASEYVKQHLGATKTIVSKIDQLVN